MMAVTRERKTSKNDKHLPSVVVLKKVWRPGLKCHASETKRGSRPTPHSLTINDLSTTHARTRRGTTEQPPSTTDAGPATCSSSPAALLHGRPIPPIPKCIRVCCQHGPGLDDHDVASSSSSAHTEYCANSHQKSCQILVEKELAASQVFLFAANVWETKEMTAWHHPKVMGRTRISSRQT